LPLCVAILVTLSCGTSGVDKFSRDIETDVRDVDAEFDGAAKRLESTLAQWGRSTSP
jgi:hypothetical protein